MKKLIILIALAVGFCSCSKDIVTAQKGCYLYRDCLGNDLVSVCDQTESQAADYQKAHNYCSHVRQ